MRSIRRALPAEGAVPGLLVLASGKKLYARMGAADFGRQADAERGFWVVFAEILASHPNLTKRVRAVLTAERVAVPQPSHLHELAADSFKPAGMTPSAERGARGSVGRLPPAWLGCNPSSSLRT